MIKNISQVFIDDLIYIFTVYKYDTVFQWESLVSTIFGRC